MDESKRKKVERKRAKDRRLTRTVEILLVAKLSGREIYDSLVMPPHVYGGWWSIVISGHRLCEL